MRPIPCLSLLFLSNIVALPALATSPIDSRTIIKTYQIQSSLDDAEERSSDGRMNLDSGSLDLNNDDIIGLRFDQIDLPSDAQIKAAYLRFFGGNADSNSTEALTVTIEGEAVDDAPAFSGEDGHISTRFSSQTTSSSVQWQVPQWPNSWLSSDKHKSVDITEIINEIVSRPGFSNGNAIALMLTGNSNASRVGYLYDYTLDHPDRIRMPRLVIEYQTDHPPVCELTPQILSEASSDYLPDYSYAGYQWGEQSLPQYSTDSGTVTWVDVGDYGAVANDGQDDTSAILNAISDHQQTEGTVVLSFPAGRFHLSDVISITRSHFVIQGAGNDENGTIFQIDIPLSDNQVTQIPDVQDLEDGWNSGHWPTESDGVPYSLYSWIGGFFHTRYDGNRYARAPIADVISGKRGEHSFTIGSLERDLNVGDVVRFEWGNTADNSLIDYLTGGETVEIGSSYDGDVDDSFVTQPVTVTAIDGNTITIKEPLMHDIGQNGQNWPARIRTMHLIEQVGLSGFSIEFPQTDYQGHHKEAGYNGIYMTDVQHGWIHNVSVDQADSGIILSHTKNVTVQGVNMTGRPGHYTINTGESYGTLMKDFELWSHALHNPSFNTAAVMSVFTDGYVDAAEMDQHNGLNHQNLFDNVAVRFTPNLWDHGGSSSRTPTALQFNTFWNIGIQELPFNQQAGQAENAPGARIIGLHSPGNTLNIDYTPNPYVEGLNQCSTIESLYDYQLQQRLADSQSTYSALLGWNLAGNHTGNTLDPVAVFGDKDTPVSGISDNIISLWQWNADQSVWQLFTPSKTASELSAYAAANGYQVLTQIESGHGFWVNAGSTLDIPLPGRAALAGSSSFTAGWSLNTNHSGQSWQVSQVFGSAEAPHSFTSHINSIWAWDNTSNQWKFYTPQLDTTELNNYIEQHNYQLLDTISPGEGYWVNSTEPVTVDF